MPGPMKTEEQFWSRCKRCETGCLEYQGKPDKDGYMVVNFRTRVWKAHRLAYFLSTGEDPGEDRICHHCDNPPCIEISHLFRGSVADNNSDKVKKGRLKRGESVKTSKLTEEQVAYIKFKKRGQPTLESIAAELGVSISLLWKIRRGINWPHVQR
jgi:hypothetical protein